MSARAHVDLERFGRAIRLHRDRRRLKDVCPEIGVSLATLSRLERCVFLPDVNTYLRVCLWLECPMEHFIKREPE